MRREGREEALGPTPDDLEVFLSDGKSIGTPAAVFAAVWNNNVPQLVEKSGIADLTAMSINTSSWAWRNQTAL